MKLIISTFPSFRLRSILWTIECSCVFCRLLKILFLYYNVNIFFTFHIIFPGYLFCVRSAKEPMISSIHKQGITNNCWITSNLMFVVSCVIGVIIFSGERTMTGQVGMDRTNPWRSGSTGISDSVFVSFSCWKNVLCYFWLTLVIYFVVIRRK